MNTNALKKFAQNARRKLLDQVGARMEFVLNTDSAELREKASQVRKLREEINASSKDHVIEKVAYTWFNRLMALRFMDANDYQPLGIRVVTPKVGYSIPEILDEAKQGNINDELPVKSQHIFDLLDGRIPSSNPQNEAYKELLIGACNYLNKTFPFLFERISDYTELLLPDDLTSEFSIVHNVREGMTIEDCQEVEIIGWLYQFYISEKKDEVFASKSKVKAEDIPAATQLFTPRWIVEYMVQNTLGKLWLQNKPQSKLRDHMPYFIESESLNADEYLKVNSVEEITLLDQACGSGHILVYAFELLTKIYEEEGYNSSEIPQLIIKKNLYGFEIDERASQLAGFALLMKARSYHRRVFRKEINPNILRFQDLKLTDLELEECFEYLDYEPTAELKHDLKLLRQATSLGSLIPPHASLSEVKKVLEKINQNSSSDAFLELNVNRLNIGLKQLQLLSSKYDCVVDNPPYMGGGNMNKELADFVRVNYPNGKADLMACFIESGLKVLKVNGFLGMINQHTWMFLSSYEDKSAKLRSTLIESISFDTMLHTGKRTFPEIGGEVVQNTCFTLWKSKPNNSVGVYIRLTQFNSSEAKRLKALEALRSNSSDILFHYHQSDFKLIPSFPIAYWVSNTWKSVFLNPKIGEITHVRKGIDTGKNDRFLRFFHEVNSKSLSSKSENGKWFPYIKGGSYRKWYGNLDLVVNWSNDGYEIRNHPSSTIRNQNYFFKEAITWSLTGSTFGARYVPTGCMFDNNGSSIYPEKDILSYLMLLISIYSREALAIINPTLAFQVGDIARIPIPNISLPENLVIEDCIRIAKSEWDSKEQSVDFKRNPLLESIASDLEDSFELYKQYWKIKLKTLQQAETEINEIILGTLGLKDEISSEVPLHQITLLSDETSIKGERIVFDSEEILAQFISYSVGCMFGRYSLDNEGLIIADQGEKFQDYFAKVDKTQSEISFLPDKENIIPILEDEWFEDDIVGRFNEFLKVTFGKENFEKNLAFVEECIGKTIRKYFAKDFYTDHIKRYKKRPIYWMFGTPGGSFNILIYMHRYTPDLLNNILNDYLREYQEKLRTRIEYLDHLIEMGSASEQTKAAKEKDKLNLVLIELQEYERDVLYPLATERIEIDLDDGVLVNYNKFGKAIKEVKGLNDRKTKDKVRKFDWVDTSEIR